MTFKKGDLVARGETTAIVEADEDAARQAVTLYADGKRFVGYAPQWTLVNRQPRKRHSRSRTGKPASLAPILGNKNLPASAPAQVETVEGVGHLCGTQWPVTHCAVQWENEWTCFMAYGMLTAEQVCILGTRVPYDMARAVFPNFTGLYLMPEQVDVVRT